MSLQWTIVAGFLYAEIGVVLLLLLPVISPARWQKIFRSTFLNYLSRQGAVYFTVLLGVLCLFLLDALREMSKYSVSQSNTEHHDHQHLDQKMQESMRLFRAQRNFYISGFSLFLCLVIRRLAVLISTQASLMAENQAALQQARSATTTARNLMTEKQGSGEEDQNNSNSLKDQLKAKETIISSLEEKLEGAEKNLKDAQEKLKKSEKENEALISQDKGLSREYDRLAEENAKLQKLFNASDKKSD